MAVSLIQTKTGGASSQTATATFDSTPTQGNLLIAVINWVTNGSIATAPSGWNEAKFAGGATHGFLVIYYKVAGASEPTNPAWTAASTAVWHLSLYEYSGLTAAPLDQVASAGPSFVTTIGTGTTPTTAQADELLFAAVATPEVTRTFSNTWGNSFTRVIQTGRQETASLIVSATGAYTTSEAWTTASWGIGVIVTFKIASSGTNTKVNIGDTFKDVSELKINIGDTWKTVTKVQVNIGDTWKTVFG